MAERNSYSNQYRFRNAVTENDQPMALDQHAKAARSVREDMDISMTSRQSNASQSGRSIARVSKALKTNTYSRVNKTTLMECMSEKQIETAMQDSSMVGKHYSTANLQIPVKDNDHVVGLLRERCSNYQRTNCQLSNDLLQANEEINRLKELYEGKLVQVSNVSSEITTRIEKEQAEKNLFIKEINFKNIEINRLRESYSVLKAENETLNLMLREKQNEVEQLEGRLEEVQLQRDRLEKYQLEASSTANSLQWMEEKVIQLDNETKLKDKTIEDLKSKISQFCDKIENYESKVLELEQAASNFSTERSKLNDKLAEAQAQCEEWKESYLSVNRELEHLPEVQIKLKNALMTNDDLQTRIQDLLEAQQKLKLQVSSQSVKDRRISQLESALQSCQRSLREKDELLDQSTQDINRMRSQTKHSATYQETISGLERQLDQKMRDFKALERKFEQKNILSNNLDRELKRLTDQNDKFRERNEKWDQIFKENKRLTGLLMDKINQIEKLQHSLNTLESRIATLTNELLKQTALFEQSNETVYELNSTLQTLQVKFEESVTSKNHLELKCGTLIAEVTSLSKSLTREKEGTKHSSMERESLKRQIQQLQSRVTQESTRLELARKNFESQMLHERDRQNQLTNQVSEVRRRCEQLARRQKDQSETISTLENDKRTMLNEYSTLRSNYEQVVIKNSMLDKWHTGYVQFMSAVNRTVGDMEHTSQQLLV